jgi:ankyrin repeat protein
MNPRKPSLIGAVIDGDTETVRALLAAGSDVNETVSGGRTPLIMAILFERTQIITLLLEAGADPHQPDSLGLNAADWAERKGLNLLGRKQEIPPVPPGKKPMPLGGVAQNQSEKQTTRASGASTQSASDDEKSRRWLAGMKRRIDEEASRKTKEVEPMPPPTTEVAPENQLPRGLVNHSVVEASSDEAERAVISVPVERLPNSRAEALLKNKISAAQTKELLRPQSPAIDATPLVGANQPLFASFTSPPETAWMVWLLVVLVLSFIIGAAVTYFIILH